ncbi:hypothetical protein [Commensalibacter sp. M0355]|uniref:hypothetical protein n=2 Tax=unclassified Commensalibacter TaxID=2630218 RepID=UPI001E4DC963|nr:hypothetical protein [Commensalibacter sp. M0355]
MMRRKLYRSLYHHEHWFAEWWSAILLLSAGIYVLIIPESEILHPFFIQGYLKIISNQVWYSLFIFIGFVQFAALSYESLLGRAIAAFFASTMFIWETLNNFVYGSQSHFCLFAWGIFALINLYALTRILSGVEQVYEYNL